MKAVTCPDCLKTIEYPDNDDWTRALFRHTEEGTCTGIYKDRDVVSNPEHYTHSDIECIDAITAALSSAGAISFCLGNAMKYIWRHDHKGSPVEDLRKAQWYLSHAITLMEKR